MYIHVYINIKHIISRLWKIAEMKFKRFQLNYDLELRPDALKVMSFPLFGGIDLGIFAKVSAFNFCRGNGPVVIRFGL